MKDKPKQEAFFVDRETKQEVKTALAKIQPKRSEKEVIAECVRIALPIIMRAEEVRSRFMARAINWRARSGSTRDTSDPKSQGRGFMNSIRRTRAAGRQMVTDVANAIKVGNLVERHAV